MTGREWIIIGVVVLVYFVLDKIVLTKIVTSSYKKLNLYFEERDYAKTATYLLMKKNLPGMKEWDRSYYLSWCYFGLNDLKWFEHYRQEYYDMRIPDSQQRLEREPQMIEFWYVVLLYLHGEVKKAEELYKKLTEDKDGLENRAKGGGYLVLVLVAQMAYSYHKTDDEDVKEQYIFVKRFACGSEIKAIAAYYMCLIYEKENNKEDINKLMAEITQEQNYYWQLFDKWRNGQKETEK